MKRVRLWMTVPCLVALLGVSGCGERADSAATVVAQSTTQGTTSSAPAKTLFHFSKADSKSLAENVLWDYLDALDRQDLDKVMDMMNVEMQGVYQMDDRIALRNFKSVKVKRIYDMTAQAPKSDQYVEAHYFYVEVDYTLNHLLEDNDKDGENYRMGVIARETQDSPYKVVEYSHVPKLKEVSADTPDTPGQSVAPPQNPSQMIEGARK
ncbi:hypothetical protein [Tumebacillus permanentifrigoris]|uniref:Uncharacterized protein n=1 Tax=Tumebacillus permanentifrigoris TaxID=378543 RepID=A0A316DBP7_9BACL|nr:hypothetical protein [Tumebacillus permanentifrigoris]PWK13454.1 hypothetical protein C7459_107122 [Tumebacillus permanentifrigoris]